MQGPRAKKEKRESDERAAQGPRPVSRKSASFFWLKPLQNNVYKVKQLLCLWLIDFRL